MAAMRLTGHIDYNVRTVALSVLIEWRRRPRRCGRAHHPRPVAAVGASLIMGIG